MSFFYVIFLLIFPFSSGRRLVRMVPVDRNVPRRLRPSPPTRSPNPWPACSAPPSTQNPHLQQPGPTERWRILSRRGRNDEELQGSMQIGRRMELVGRMECVYFELSQVQDQGVYSATADEWRTAVLRRWPDDSRVSSTVSCNAVWLPTISILSECAPPTPPGSWSVTLPSTDPSLPSSSSPPSFSRSSPCSVAREAARSQNQQSFQRSLRSHRVEYTIQSLQESDVFFWSINTELYSERRSHRVPSISSLLLFHIIPRQLSDLERALSVDTHQLEMLDLEQPSFKNAAPAAHLEESEPFSEHLVPIAPTTTTTRHSTTIWKIEAAWDWILLRASWRPR